MHILQITIVKKCRRSIRCRYILPQRLQYNGLSVNFIMVSLCDERRQVFYERQPVRIKRGQIVQGGILTVLVYSWKGVLGTVTYPPAYQQELYSLWSSIEQLYYISCYSLSSLSWYWVKQYAVVMPLYHLIHHPLFLNNNNGHHQQQQHIPLNFIK